MLLLLHLLSFAFGQDAGADVVSDGMSTSEVAGWGAMAAAGVAGGGTGGYRALVWVVQRVGRSLIEDATKDLQSRVKALEDGCADEAQDARIKAVEDALSKAIEKADDRWEAHRATMAEMDARITAAGAPSEAQQQLRERLARLEARHEATSTSIHTLREAVDGVRALLLEARRG